MVNYHSGLSRQQSKVKSQWNVRSFFFSSKLSCCNTSIIKNVVQPVYISVSVCISFPVCISIPVYISVSVCISIPVYISVCISIPVYMSVSVCISIPVYISVSAPTYRKELKQFLALSVNLVQGLMQHIEVCRSLLWKRWPKQMYVFC